MIVVNPTTIRSRPRRPLEFKVYISYRNVFLLQVTLNVYVFYVILGGQRMPLLGQGPGMGNQAGPGANRPFNQDVDFRDQNQGPNQRGSGPVDKDMTT
jgi:hypothetical protein